LASKTSGPSSICKVAFGFQVRRVENDEMRHARKDAEEAVQAFIDERISLTDIPRVIEAVMDSHDTQPATELAAILEADHSARLSAVHEIQRFSRTAPQPA